MRRTSLFAVLGAFLFLGAFQVNGSDEKEKKKKGAEIGKERTQSKDAKAIRALHAAYEIAAIGKERNSPEALIAAARILGTSGRTKSELSKGSEVKKQLDFDETKEALEWLEVAMKMASGSDGEGAIKTLVAEARNDIKETKRGGVFGGRCYSGYFAGDGYDRADTFSVLARGGQWLNISLNGWGPPGLDLDLELIDNATNSVVASDRSIGPGGYVSYFVPYGPARSYRFRVINYQPNTPCDRYTVSHN